MSGLVHQPIYFADREAYFAWAMAQPRGRFERIDGDVVTMAPERAGHARIKARVWTALEDAIKEAGVPCEAFPDGMTVAVDDKHYLILNARKPEIVHHERRADGSLLTRMMTSGELSLDPPGIRLSVEKIYQALVQS